jgi:hypothetical protein
MKHQGYKDASINVRRMLALSVLALVLTAAMRPTQGDVRLATVRWLQGHWHTAGTGSNQTAEVWRALNDSTWTAFGYTLTGTDTTFKEYLRLEKRGTDITYYATVPNQNGGKAVLFAATAITPDSLVVENPMHDFPSKIVYRRLDDNTLLATVSGLRGDKVIGESTKLVRK